MPRERRGEDVHRAGGDRRLVACPACGEASRLVSRSLGGERLSVLECGRCAGLWLGNEVFSHLEESSQEQAAAGDAGPPLSARTAAAERRPDLETARYRPCPVCTQLMHRRNYGRRSGVVVDTCWTHGLWFDQGELDSILDWLRRGGLARAWRWDRQLEVEEERVRAFGRDDRAPHVWPDRDVATSRSPLADFLGGVLSFPGTRV